jgi:hypothetical protein
MYSEGIRRSHCNFGAVWFVLEKNPMRMADWTKSHSEWRRVPWRRGRSSNWEVGEQDLMQLGGGHILY